MFLMPWRRQGQAQSGGLSRRAGDWAEDFRREMDSLLEHFFSGSLTPAGQEGGNQRFWGLTLNQEGNEVIVRAEVPGFEDKDLDVQLNDDVLTIRAEKKQQGKEGQRYERYERTITLPPGVDAERAQATCQHGVLELRIPRSQQAQGKRIPIHSGAALASNQAAAQAGTTPRSGNGAEQASTAQKQEANRAGTAKT